MSRRILSIAAILLANIVQASAQDAPTFQCEDLKAAGLVLVPVSSPDYDALLGDIRKRIDNPPPGAPRMMFGKISPEKRATSAILLNKSDKSIAALQLVWVKEEFRGRKYTGSWTNAFGKTVLLPFGAQPGWLAVMNYWYTILPGSKRYLGEGEMAGDNTDVRMPRPDEILNGGGGMGGGGGSGQAAPLKSVTLVIDGVFFTDGEFAGPDQYGLWESIRAEAKTKLDIAKTAKEGRRCGATASDILEEIANITGPASLQPRLPGRGPITDETAMREELQKRANEIDSQRKSIGDERTVDLLAAQADTKLPDFRKR